MNAGLECAEPDHSTHQDIGGDALHAEAIERGGHAEAAESTQQPGELDRLRIEGRDHEDGEDVVNDRERQHHDLEPVRHPGAEQRQAADDERDVRGHRHRPGGAALDAMEQGEEDEDRRHRPTQRGGHRHKDLAQLP